MPEKIDNHSFYLQACCLVFLWFGCCLLPCAAEDVTAASLKWEDVKAAVDKAAGTGGGIVLLPEGKATWDDDLQLTGDVSLIGKGADKTRLFLGRKANVFLDWNLRQGHSRFIRISGIGFYAIGREPGDAKSQVIRINNADNYRIDHCLFEGVFHMAITLSHTPKGLTDNCIFKRVWTADPHLDSTGYGIVPPPQSTRTEPRPKTPDSIVKGYQAGVDAKNRNSAIEAGYTVVAALNDRKLDAAAVFNLDNKKDTGTIARLFFYLNSAADGATVDLGIFRQVKDNILATRSVLAGIKVKQGMNVLTRGQDFTNLEIASGDYLGLYLNKCTLAAQSKAGTASWQLAGNQVPCTNKDFGKPAAAQISLYAELYDKAGVMEQYEKSWDDWYAGEHFKELRNGVYYDADWQPDDLTAHFVEDNTFYWFKGAVGPYAGSLAKMVVRKNRFIAEHIKYYLMIFNPGTVCGIVYDNIFEKLPGSDTRYDGGIVISSPGLIYNNTFKGITRSGMLGQARASQGYYYTDLVRLKDLYIFGNKYIDCEDSGDDAAHWRLSSGGNRANNWIAENLSHFFRPPQPGERLYSKDAGTNNFREADYPHPLRSDDLQ